MRVAQLRWCEGFRRRRAEAPTMQNAAGRTVPNPHGSLAELAPQRCPSVLPAEQRERWIAGYLHADSIGVAKGQPYLERQDPARRARPKREKVAEPLEMFPEAVLTKEQVRAAKAAKARAWMGA